MQWHILRIGTISTLAIFCLAAAPSPVQADAVPGPAEVESAVREHFSDAPVMAAIARCESKLRQFSDDGTVLRGGLGNGMIGVFQINERVHTNRAETLGFDLSTLDGNLGYARHLYTRQGTVPWNSSRSCWKKAIGTSFDPAAKAEGKREELLARIAQLQELLALYQQLLALR